MSHSSDDQGHAIDDHDAAPDLLPHTTIQRPIQEMNDLPRPEVRRGGWPSYLTWMVPLLVLGATLYYANFIARDHGADVVLTLPDANVIEPGKTLVRSRGVEIGKVTAVTLSADRASAKIHLRLRREADAFAKEGARYWLVQPDFSGGSLNGLSTVLRGPYFDAIAGDGPQQLQFDALPRAPVSEAEGFHIQLLADRLNHIGPGTPVSYRGVEVGAIVGSALADDATHVLINATLEARYAPLVRRNSAFWFEAPAEVKGGLFSGVELKLGSLRSLFAGAITFASPDEPLGEPALEGGAFALYAEMPKGAEKWRPQIAVATDSVAGKRGTDPSVRRASGQIQSPTTGKK